jgi:hypothetical protein
VKPLKTSVRIAGLRDEILNSGPPEYKAGVLTTRPRRLFDRVISDRNRPIGDIPSIMPTLCAVGVIKLIKITKLSIRNAYYQCHALSVHL